MERAPMNAGTGGGSRYPSASSHTITTPSISVHFGSEQRKYTAISTSDLTGSSSTLENSTVPTPPSTILQPQQFLHLLPHTRHLVPQCYNASSPTPYLQPRGPSPSRRGVSPDRRIPDNRWDKGQDGFRSVVTTNGSGGWVQTGRRNDIRRTSSGAPRNHGNGSTPGKKDVQQPTRRPPNRRNSSNQGNLSSSMPSTPNHQPRNITSKSRSPSPHTALLDSPKSAASEPIRGGVNLRSPCKFETLLSTVRRRFKYTDSESLPKETPPKHKLTESEDQKLTKDMDQLFQKLVPSEESNDRRRQLVVKLENLFHEHWPENRFQVAPFGSSENKLCTSESDIDVCIIVRYEDQINTCALSKALADSGMERVICVPGAKVPIVKIWDPLLSVACDMNINNTMAIENTRMMKIYVEIDPRVRPLAMILKYWTKQRLLNDALGATLGSYTWLCMILNYLQTRNPPVLPSLHERPHKQGPIIQGMDCSFDDDIDALRGFGEKNKESLGSLLFGFFKFYGYEVDYQNSVMSVRKGKLLEKADKGWHIGHNNIICVEEPFNVWRNLSNTCDSYSAIGLHKEFRRGFKILAEKLDLDALCEHYVFPQDEAPSYVPPPPSRDLPKSASLRNNSQPNRGRGGHSGGRGNRNFNSHPKNGQYRKTPSAFTNVQVPSQLLGVHDMYMVQPVHQHMYQPDVMNINLQAQIQAQHILHTGFAQAQAQAQAQAHIQNQQNYSHNNTQQTINQDLGHNLSAVAYYARMLGFPFYYVPITTSAETTLTPASPPSTPSASDSKSHYGKDGQCGGYVPSPRSQPHTDAASSKLGGSAQTLTTTAGPSEDELDFADLSSNGSLNYGHYHPPPETPPEDGEYVGYYIGEGLPNDSGGSSSCVVEEEPFVQQKYIVDRQKRLSQEKLPPPLIRRSRPSSPHRDRYPSTPSFTGAKQLSSREGYHEERGPLIVNGSTSSQSLIYSDESYPHSVIDTASNSYPFDQVYDPSGAAPHLVTHAMLNPHVNYSLSGELSTPLLPVHEVLRTSSDSAVDFAFTTGYGQYSAENTVDGETDESYSAPEQKEYANTPLSHSKTPQESHSDTPVIVTVGVDIKDSHPIKDLCLGNGDQSVKIANSGESKSKSVVLPNISKKQGKNNAISNGQPKRKTNKPQGQQPSPTPALDDTVPTLQPKMLAKDAAKPKTWTKSKQKRLAKKQAPAQGSDRKEALVEGERKGG